MRQLRPEIKALVRRTNVRVPRGQGVVWVMRPCVPQLSFDDLLHPAHDLLRMTALQRHLDHRYIRLTKIEMCRYKPSQLCRVARIWQPR